MRGLIDSHAPRGWLTSANRTVRPASNWPPGLCYLAEYVRGSAAEMADIGGGPGRYALWLARLG